MFFCSTFRGWFTQTEFAVFLNHFLLCVFVVCLEFEQNSEAKGDTEDWQRGRCKCRLLISVSESSAIVNFGTPGRNAKGERIALLCTTAADLRISILDNAQGMSLARLTGLTIAVRNELWFDNIKMLDRALDRLDFSLSSIHLNCILIVQ